MRKGISGHTLVVIISIIVAMLGLILFWLFLSQTTTKGLEFARDISKALCDTLKNIVPGGGIFINCG